MHQQQRVRRYRLHAAVAAIRTQCLDSCLQAVAAVGYTLYTLHRQCKNVFMFYVAKKFQRFLLSGNGT